MTVKVLALTEDGKMTYCAAAPDQRGKGRCNHIAHKEKGESTEDFFKRIEPQNIIDLQGLEGDGLHLQYVKDQTPELCMASVKQNGMALRYVINQTPELCMTAVKQDWRAYADVKDKTPEIMTAATK